MEEGEQAVGGIDDRQAPVNEAALSTTDQQRAQFGVDRPQFRSASPTDRSGLTHGDRPAGRLASLHAIWGRRGTPNASVSIKIKTSDIIAMVALNKRMEQSWKMTKAVKVQFKK